MRKVVGHNKELISELQMTRNEKNRLENELKDFQSILDKLTEEIEQKMKEDSEVIELKKEKEIFEEKIKNLNLELLAKKEELLTKIKTLQELMTENEKLNNDVEYFKNVALTSKNFAEKAIADVEVYRKMLEKAKISQN